MADIRCLPFVVLLKLKKKGGGLADLDATSADEEAPALYFKFCE